MKEWFSDLQQELVRLFGQGEGTRLSMVVFSSILSDFQKELEKAGGRRVAEEYRLDDRELLIRLEGEGTRLLHIDVNGKRIIADAALSP